MKIVGLTGGIGSGKTTVCRIFEQLGIPVFYADDEAKALYNIPQVAQRVAEALGADVLDESGAVNRKKMASAIFSDPAKLAAINALIHPLVKERFSVWMKEQEQQAPYCIREAAILIESGSYKDCDKIILVTAPEEQRIARVMLRDGSEYEQVRDRIRSQMSEDEKKNYADYIILNEEQDSLIRQVIEIHQQIIHS